MANRHWEQNKEATVYVGNLDERFGEAMMWEMMTQMGPVVNLHMPMDRVSRTHQGYGFVEFDTPETADYASRALNGIRVFGKVIRVNKASADKQKTAEIGAELFVNNLDSQVDEKILYDTFSRFGQLVTPPNVVRDANNISKGYGFVNFDSFEASDAAKETMSGQYLLSKQIVVEYAYKKDGKGERHGDQAERKLAAEGKKHNIVPEKQPLPPAFLMTAPAATPTTSAPASNSSGPPPNAPTGPAAGGGGSSGPPAFDPTSNGPNGTAGGGPGGIPHPGSMAPHPGAIPAGFGGGPGGGRGHGHHPSHGPPLPVNMPPQRMPHGFPGGGPGVIPPPPLGLRGGPVGVGGPVGGGGHSGHNMSPVVGPPPGPGISSIGGSGINALPPAPSGLPARPPPSHAVFNGPPINEFHPGAAGGGPPGGGGFRGGVPGGAGGVGGPPPLPLPMPLPMSPAGLGGGAGVPGVPGVPPPGFGLHAGPPGSIPPIPPPGAFAPPPGFGATPPGVPLPPPPGFPVRR